MNKYRFVAATNMPTSDRQANVVISIVCTNLLLSEFDVASYGVLAVDIQQVVFVFLLFVLIQYCYLFYHLVCYFYQFTYWCRTIIQYT